MEQTEVIHEPARRIDTFGSTMFEYVLISELMDSVNEVRVREGRMEAMRPQILRPEGYNDLFFEGFGEQADAFQCLAKAGQQFAAQLDQAVHHQEVEVEGQVLFSNVLTSAGSFLEKSIMVRADDGRISVKIGRPGSGRNTCLCWIILRRL